LFIIITGVVVLIIILFYTDLLLLLGWAEEGLISQCVWYLRFVICELQSYISFSALCDLYLLLCTWDILRVSGNL